MAVMDTSSTDPDMLRIWNLLVEVAEQLNQNRAISISLHNVSGNVKAQSIHSQTGFVLRRFNLDKSKEAYDAELERMNAAMSAENQTLMNDNKQLNALIKEYELTLENLMATFRTRANEVQQRELALIREYETKLLIRETEELVQSLAASGSMSTSLGRLGTLLRSVMRVLTGEDPESAPFLEAVASASESGNDPSSSSSSATPAVLALAAAHEFNSLEASEGPVDSEKDRQLAAAEWSLERECELARLEKENEHLRRLLAEHVGINPAANASSTPARLPEFPKLTGIPKVAARTHHSQLGGREVGPFGTYKKLDGSG